MLLMEFLSKSLSKLAMREERVQDPGIPASSLVPRSNPLFLMYYKNVNEAVIVAAYSGFQNVNTSEATEKPKRPQRNLISPSKQHKYLWLRKLRLPDYYYSSTSVKKEGGNFL